jgi:hypothetical protein
MRVSDADLVAVVSCLPHLTELTIDAMAPFTGRAVRLVGEHCRSLKSLSLDVALDVSDLENSSEPVLFPHLTRLELRLPSDWPSDR